MKRGAKGPNKSRIQRLTEKELNRHLFEQLQGGDPRTLPYGIPCTLVPADHHVTDGLVDRGGHLLFNLGDLFAYLQSACVTGDQRIFEATEKEAVYRASGGFETSESIEPYFKDYDQMVTYVTNQCSSDILLLIISQCICVSIPMLYYNLRSNDLYAGIHNIYRPLQRLVDAGYITKTSARSADLPFLGVARDYYSITNGGIAHLNSVFPALLIDFRSSANAGAGKLLHGYHTTLSALRIFTVLRKRSVTPTIRYETALVTQSRAHEHGYAAKASADDVQTDALITYGESVISLEQDMHTESIPQVVDKLDSYFNSGAVGYGDSRLLNTEKSCVIFSTHTADIAGRESVLKQTTPFSLVHRSISLDALYGLAIYISRKEPDLSSIGDGIWEDHLKELIIKTFTIIGDEFGAHRGKDGLTRFDRLVDHDHITSTLGYIKEILAFYHSLDPERYNTAVSALIAHYHYKVENDWQDQYDDYRNDLRLYPYHYSAFLQDRPTKRRLAALAEYYIKKVLSLDGGILKPSDGSRGFISKDLECIAAGFSFYVVPGLSLGKYLPFILDDTYLDHGDCSISAAARYAAAVYDLLAYGDTPNRRYFPVTPGYAGSPETQKGIHLDTLVGDCILRLRNCAMTSSSEGRLTICVEMAFDACSWARTRMYLKTVRQRVNRANRANANEEDRKELKNNDRKVMMVCESKEQIKQLAEAAKMYNLRSGKESLLDPGEVCYCLLSDLRETTETRGGVMMPIYLCMKDGKEVVEVV